MIPILISIVVITLALFLLPYLVSIIINVLLYFVGQEFKKIRIAIYIILVIIILNLVSDFASKITHQYVLWFLTAIVIVIIYKIIKSKG